MTRSDRARIRSRLRLAGWISLTVGFCWAGGVFIRSWSAADRDSGDPGGPMTKMQARQVENLYGKIGLVSQDLGRALQRPENQALMICAGTLLVGGLCFYVGGWFSDSDQGPQRNRS